MAVTLVLSILIVLVILYFFLTKNYKYWQKRGIPCPDGALPGVGHFWEVTTQKITISEWCCRIYNAYRDRSMVGIYNFMTPTLMVREPELVKTVLQTSFTNFHENGLKIDPKLDPLLANNPFFNYGEKWMTGRKRLTYAFSSMRLKILLETVKQVCQTFEGYLDKKIDKAGKVELELKELFSRFTSQVVSGAGFGIDGLSFNEEKEKDSFYAMDVMEQRRKEATPRNDFLQLMSDLERIEGDKFNLEILTSHAVSFFVDGYETSSSVLSFIGFHLASNPKVQEKLREEVMSVLNKYDDVITYEALKDMTYMDQVINESMRILPTLGFLSKVCTEETELRGSDGLVCRVERGMYIMISISGLQTDPRYWENPEEFDPDRFGPDRKHNIEKFTFLPFGEGPRMCVGMRMAQLQMKACLATFLRKYSIELSPKTQLPLKMISSTFLANAEGGLWSIIQPI
ncbi:PREDICTED: probable cytochrome P450 28d1 [Atta colombica]|uniref:probable cytochrome P450 28d1 n=1 Tax=Atta colombica TaxID=520822 RepID=UPI00084C7B19|nr:PREDICTED: probable cytochrome P450 28d1 [Atta colombica]